MDAYKLCKLARKPTPRGVRDIGAWYTAFNVTIIFSVITNCALLSMDKDLRATFGLGRSDPELGFGLQRDLSEYSEDYYDGIDVKKCMFLANCLLTFNISRTHLHMNIQIHFLDQHQRKKRKSTS